MKRKTITKNHTVNATYHVYNRGNNKAAIFLDSDDYKYFLYLIGFYLNKPNRYSEIQRLNFHNKIKLHAFCLMPNHYHFLLSQAASKDMGKFIKSLSLRYIRFFNKKYGRVGHLFQGRYKARFIESSYDFMNISKYIHRNPKEIVDNIEKYPYSSIRYYTTTSRTLDFLYTEDLKAQFSYKPKSYKQYIYDESQT